MIFGIRDCPVSIGRGLRQGDGHSGLNIVCERYDSKGQDGSDQSQTWAAADPQLDWWVGSMDGREDHGFALIEHNKHTNMKPKNTICLWFDKDAHQAAHFYAATFPDSKVISVHE